MVVLWEAIGNFLFSIAARLFRKFEKKYNGTNRRGVFVLSNDIQIIDVAFVVLKTGAFEMHVDACLFVSENWENDQNWKFYVWYFRRNPMIRQRGYTTSKSEESQFLGFVETTRLLW